MLQVLAIWGLILEAVWSVLLASGHMTSGAILSAVSLAHAGCCVAGKICPPAAHQDLLAEETERLARAR
jgi:hypothetical protein